MARADRNRLLAEKALPQDGRERGKSGRPVRSVTVNLAESPLGWLKARGLLDDRQLAAGERLRDEWERAQLAPSVTMRWDAPPIGRTPRAGPGRLDATETQLAARARFDDALSAVGPGLSDIAWRVICAGEGMRDAEQALGWPARAGRLVLGLALDRLATYYRIR
jgi:hypothetical protein